jgi:outer membrane protein assembly factor BamD
MRRMHLTLVVTMGVLTLVTGCAQKRDVVPAGTAEADKFLFERGEAALKDRKWLNAREYYRQIVDNYPQSTYRPDAKLAVGDTYIGESTTESLLLAINEFREFLTFYPTHARADYAQYRLGYAHTEQMLRPERDQSSTKEAVKELNVFVERYPNSQLMPEVQKLLRDAKDHLSEASYRVGLHYFRVKWYHGAIDRFREVLDGDPEYTHRDAVYFHLAESFMREAEQLDEKKAAEQATARRAEALPYYERLLKEFEQSEYLERAQKRVAQLKTTQDMP